jgi:nucleotide-binding universal stress UspA family protein
MKCPDISRILFATDDSPNAQHAFTYAVCMARKFDAKIVLLHVVAELFKDMIAFDFGIERSIAAQKWFSASNDYFKELKEKFNDIARKNYDFEDNVIDKVLVEKGNPVRIILQVAEDKKCDLISMGSKGRESLEDAMLGSTAVGVVRRSKIPVMLAPLQTPAEPKEN